MPSLTLKSGGADRSTISLNFSGYCGLGIMPIGLLRIGGVPCDNCTSLPFVTSSAMYSSTVVRFKSTDRKLPGGGLSWQLQLNPMRNPWLMPRSKLYQGANSEQETTARQIKIQRRPQAVRFLPHPPLLRLLLAPEDPQCKCASPTCVCATYNKNFLSVVSMNIVRTGIYISGVPRNIVLVLPFMVTGY